MASKLSAEGQHLIDALEAHFAAIRAFAANATDEVRDHVEAAWDNVLEHLDATEASFRAAGEGQVEATAQNAAAAGDAVGEAAAPAAGGIGGGAAAGVHEDVSGMSDTLRGDETDIGELVSSNTAAPRA